MIDMINYDNGYVRVVSFLEKRRDKFNKIRCFWNCLCRCGNAIVLHTYQINIKQPKGCGCYIQIRKGNSVRHDYHIKHGLSNKHPLYRTWKNIKCRVFNKNIKSYHFYGAKGISMCNEWKNDFKSFFDWSISNGWRLGLVIDRINHLGHYEPSNCRFITRSENALKVFIDHPNLHRGSNHKDAILNEEIVSKVKSLLRDGLKSNEVRKIMNLSRNMIYQIKNNITWKHVV